MSAFQSNAFQSNAFQSDIETDTTINYIGPLTPEHFHIFENDETKRDGSEKINLVCTVEQAHQLLGLCENSVKNTYGDLRILTSKNSRWGILPVQTNDNMNVNEHMTHSGLYQLLDMEYVAMGNRPDIVTVQISAEMLSKNTDEFLTVLYTRGGEDGSDIEHNYDDTVAVYQINENGSDFDTTHDWFPASKYSMTDGAIASSGGELVFSGSANTDGVTGQVWTCHRTQFSENFIMEFTMKPGTSPASGSHKKELDVWFGRYYNATTPPPNWNDSVMVSLAVESDKTHYQVFAIRTYGSYQNLVPVTINSSATAFKFRITVEDTPNIKIELSTYSGSTWSAFTQIFHGPADILHDESSWKNLYFGAYFRNDDSTTNSVKLDDVKVYTYEESTYPNVVVAPPGAVCNLTADFTRPSGDGNIQCFKDIVDDLNYQIDPENFYDGSVKAWNSNYADAVARLITHNDMDLDPTKFYVSNGLVKLVTTANTVQFYYWDGTHYALLNTFTLPNYIRLIRPDFVSKDVVTIQIDRTRWTLRAGKPGVEIEHPSTALGYTLHTCYEHDGITTTDPSANADISMLTAFYTKIWNKGTGSCASPNPAQRYRMMIIQKNMTTIKSDSIPATEKTGIVFYDSNISDSADDGSLFRAQEWFRPTHQVLVLQGV